MSDDDTVKHVDFGKDHNQAVERFARLMGIVEAHYEDVRQNPIKHLDAAGAEISRLRRIIHDAAEAYRRRRFPVAMMRFENIDETPSKRQHETRVVTLEEFEALRAAYEIIKAADR